MIRDVSYICLASARATSKILPSFVVLTRYSNTTTETFYYEAIERAIGHKF